MTTTSTSTVDRPAHAERMRLRYGFNETDNWRNFALGPQRERIQQRLRRMGTSVMRIFLFDKHAPDPVVEWHQFAAYVQAVLDVGAVPMITFAKFAPPYADAENLRTFVNRCAEVVWGCLDQWGGTMVRDWYWNVWNEPNNALIGGGLSFEQYRRIYEDTAGAMLQILQPHLAGHKARIGGPAVDGFQPFWLDWLHRFAVEIDSSLVGFASWHRYADWRPLAEWDAPAELASYEALLMAQTPEYEARAREVARLLGDRDILNVCGELNVLSDPSIAVSGQFNQTLFAAAYYASALVHLLRGRADLEMWWTATDGDSAYGVIDANGAPTPAALAKQLVAEHVRFGDELTFPVLPATGPSIDHVIAHGADGRCSGLFVHGSKRSVCLDIADLQFTRQAWHTVFTLDQKSGIGITRQPFDGKIRLDGYGVVVVTNVDGDDAD